ncbi:hypothetical protein E7Y31_08775, partial [Candidatus Frankia alpina]
MSGLGRRSYTDTDPPVRIWFDCGLGDHEALGDTLCRPVVCRGGCGGGHIHAAATGGGECLGRPRRHDGDSDPRGAGVFRDAAGWTSRR